MRVLAGCEYSGVIRDAFIAQGHDAWSCDLEPTASPGPHIQGDVLNHLSAGWDLAIFDPKRKWLQSSDPVVDRHQPMPPETAEAVEFVKKLWAAPIPRIAIISVYGYLVWHMEQPQQQIQPYHFGEDANEPFRLWLKNLPPLEHTGHIPGKPSYSSPGGRLVQVWGNQRHQQFHPEVTTIPRRGITYPGIAKAMAEQWGVNESST